MKRIPIGKSEFIIVDDEDYELINNYNWYIKYKKEEPNYPVIYTMYRINKGKPAKFKSLKPHRLVMNITDANIHIDHINGNRFDNRKCNLRICNAKQNNYNIKNNKINKYNHRGVSYDFNKQKWRAQISFNNKYENKNASKIYLGKYKYIKQAALAYDIAALILHKDFAVLNFKLRKSELKELINKTKGLEFDSSIPLNKEQEQRLRDMCKNVSLKYFQINI